MRFPSLPLPSAKDWLKTAYLLGITTFWDLLGWFPLDWAEGIEKSTGDNSPVLFMKLIFSLVGPFVSTAILHNAFWKGRPKGWPIFIPTRVSWDEALIFFLAGLAFIVPLMVLILLGFPLVIIAYSVMGMPFPTDSFQRWGEAITSDTPTIESWIFAGLIFGLWAFCAAITFRKQRLRKL